MLCINGSGVFYLTKKDGEKKIMHVNYLLANDSAFEKEFVCKLKITDDSNHDIAEARTRRNNDIADELKDYKKNRLTINTFFNVDVINTVREMMKKYIKTNKDDFVDFDAISMATSGVYTDATGNMHHLITNFATHDGTIKALQEQGLVDDKGELTDESKKIASEIQNRIKKPAKYENEELLEKTAKYLKQLEQIKKDFGIEKARRMAKSVITKSKKDEAMIKALALLDAK